MRTNDVSYREACPVCLGDMVEDEMEEGWLVCVICARSFPTTEIEALQEPAAPLQAAEVRGAA